ncbi:MAG: hypothetical protein QOF33_1179 [Thermomicrobiales bacterium]|jgi:hypothetical protein|nr:hypothetical protein [Thermomicrobiales bacterium]
MPHGNRRQLLAAALIAGSGAALRQTPSLAQDNPDATATAGTGQTGSVVGQSAMPDWSFVVRDYVDPYEAKLQFPEGIASDKRVIQAEVVIINASDQPLSFKTSDVHLLDVEGVEYAAGSAGGFEPKLVSQDLPDGERTRGSVWFVVPQSAEITQVKFFAPASQLRVRIGTAVE